MQFFPSALLLCLATVPLAAAKEEKNKGGQGAGSVQSKNGCPQFKNTDLYNPASPFRSTNTDNRNRVADAANRGGDVDAALEAAVGTVQNGDHCVSNNECACFIATNNGNRADPGETPNRNDSGVCACVAYPQGSAAMSFCWDINSCNSLQQVTYLEEPDFSIDDPIPVSQSDVDISDEDVLKTVQLAGDCPDATTLAECPEYDPTSSSSSGLWLSPAAPLAAVSALAGVAAVLGVLA